MNDSKNSILKELSIQDNFDYCSDCGVFRYKPPKPGTCPCCFSRMTSQLVSHGSLKQMVYTCTNDKCRRVCLESYLSGFWSGWREKERQVIQEIKNTSFPSVTNNINHPSSSLEQERKFGISKAINKLLEKITTKGIIT